ncbi:C69 family dipeptidase [Candidatus Enterococcus ferrettii]|uniref:Dipeptidase n=1 Tax=Candidatus Enterococcus ferrettii TaxID=2815324 RepID=A0ABV0EUB9_9ENTE|nr:C69 family dipeptidase [Enterococcus sp. 665A]MBO1339466.1 C69 family dipeptidase [Enterococcus sp. 665A]
MKKSGSCTTLLVGKKASIDGSTLIARIEDCGSQPNPQRFVVVTPDQQPKQFKSAASGVEIILPEQPLRYTSTPDADSSYGVWGGAGINSANVAMTACETVTTNSRVLSIDPFYEKGLGEADFVTTILPYITSAREGVLRLGELLEKYGTYESNGISFSDKDEIWYVETIGGHHWAAIRIPDDAYAIAPNRMNIDVYDFDDSNSLYSADLPDLIEKYQLNPDFEGINLRHIFGSSTDKDAHYNNPRTWYIQKAFSPKTIENKSPEDQNLPFFCSPERKLSIEDIKWALSSHYQNTPFDPYGEGTEIEKKKYRSIGLNRNEETHVLQIRPDVPDEIAGIHWLAYGPNTFNSLVPFYANVDNTPQNYFSTPSEFDPTSIYWLTKLAALIGDSNFSLYSEMEQNFEKRIMIFCQSVHHDIEEKVNTRGFRSSDLSTVNQKMANYYYTELNVLLGEMVKLGTVHMKLRFP